MNIESQLISEFDGQLETELTVDEGERKKRYKDSRGIWTIGKGHNLQEYPLPKGWTEPITDAQEQQLFRQDIARAKGDVIARLPWFLAKPEDARKGVIYDLSFNMGITRLLAFHDFLNFYASNHFPEASHDLLTTLYARQVPTRARRLAQQMLTNKWATAIDIA